MNFASINPFTEKELAVYSAISDHELEHTLVTSNSAQKTWAKLPIEQRITSVAKLSELLKQEHEKLAELATLEMGKTLAEAKLEVLKCARGCDYYAQHAASFLAPKSSVAETGKTVQLNYEPLGVIVGVFPWNFPFWQILRSAIPTILAGNTMLVKPAPNVPQCSLAIQELVRKAGFPNGIIEVIFATENQVAQLLADTRIKAATLTGSEKAGSAVASQAAKHIKKSVLELGGSDPFIVMQDADLETTLNQAIVARFQNNGQSCIAAKRFILHENIVETFLHGLKERMSKLVCGNPMEANTNIGPLARIDLSDKLAKQVSDSVEAGAQIYFQHPQVPPQGYFYPPTILTNITPNAVAFHEELFGPVVSVYTFSKIEEAIELANATEFGLGASVWSKDTENAISIAKQIECGQVFINEMVKSQPGHPFGGAKKSGYGRELGEFGMYEFCNVKTLWI
jgi:succinate-semialdehyde dehydrogenase/glutarate-semialdehyde dehydrogenase